VYETEQSLFEAAARDAYLNEVEKLRAVDDAFLASLIDDDGTDNLACNRCDLVTRDPWSTVKRFNKHKASLNGRSKWKSRR
jgi:uncharacterized C2H2 Zn-finger protein